MQGQHRISRVRARAYVCVSYVKLYNRLRLRRPERRARGSPLQVDQYLSNLEPRRTRDPRAGPVKPSQARQKANSCQIHSPKTQTRLTIHMINK